MIVEKSAWITDALPERNQDVLITAECNGIKDVFDAYYDEGWFLSNGLPVENVLAWRMPVEAYD
ncbi:MAG TPA: hypothetical protein VGD31_09140 [Sphingobacteriaceae bacterium]